MKKRMYILVADQCGVVRASADRSGSERGIADRSATLQPSQTEVRAKQTESGQIFIYRPK